MKKFHLLLGAIVLIMACSTIGRREKISPQFTGIDPKAQPYLDEYLGLAKLNDIYFPKMPTIGFDDINDANTVGVCWMNPFLGPREITIDKSFWENTTSQRRQALVFHELTHCLCNRDHDYGKDKPYPENNAVGTVIVVMKNLVTIPKEDDGFYDDGCPISLMYPEIVASECMNRHYIEYIKEMFARCDPW